MLRLLRSKKVAKKILIGLALIIIPAFVLWGARYQSKTESPSHAGIIFGKKISFDEYTVAWRAVRNEAMLRYEDFNKIYKQLDLKGEAWNRLILLHEAGNQKINASNDEVVDTIRRFPFLIRDNRFDNELYQHVVTNTFRMTAREFEEDMRDSIMIQKLLATVSQGLDITDEELLRQYKDENEKIVITYVTQTPKDFAEKVEVTDEDVENYYSLSAQEFKNPERVNIEYIEFHHNDYKEGVEIGGDEIRYYYDSHIDEYEHPESVHARHILLEAEEEAKNVLKKARAGEDFAELARQFSTGPTKASGGDLGFFERGKMVKEFEDAAFGMEAGGISEVVKTQFGYHVIKVEERKEPFTDEFDSVKEEVKNTLLVESAKNSAYEEALLASGSIDGGEDLAAVAKKYGKTVKTTGYFSRQGMIPNIGWDPDLQKEAFDMKLNEPSPLISPNETESNANYIIRVLEKREAEIPPLEEVKDKVLAKVKQNKMNDLAKESMEQHKAAISEKMKSGISFKQAAEAAGLEVKETDLIAKRDYIKDIGPAKDIEEVFGYEVGHVSPVLTTTRISCLASLTEFHPIEEEKFEEEKEALRVRSLQQKKSQFLQNWLNNLKILSGLQSNVP